MGNKKARGIASALIFVLAVALIATGFVGMSRRGSQLGEEILTKMRTRSVLIATGEGAVESYVAIAKDEARAAAQAAGASMSEIRDAVAAAEEEARNNSSANLLDYDAADTTGLDAALATLSAALADYRAEEAAAQAEYVAELEASGALDAAEEEVDASQMTSEADLEAMLAEEEEVEVDMSGFVATERMNELRAVADERYASVLHRADGAVRHARPVGAGTRFRERSSTSSRRRRTTLPANTDRYNEAGGAAALDNGFQAWMIRYGDDLIYGGVGLIIAALVVFFYPALVKKLGVPRMIIGLFFVLLCVVALLYDLSLSGLMSNTLVRMGMNSILVLAMVPGIQCGIGLNLGLPIGIVGGLIGGLLAIEWQVGGWLGFALACAVGMAISAVSGALYGVLLKPPEGSEMSVTTYVGFSIVSLMCIAWLVLPFNSLELRWPLGTGLRNTIVMSDATSFGPPAGQLPVVQHRRLHRADGPAAVHGAVLLCGVAVHALAHGRGDDGRGQQPPVRRGDRRQRRPDAHRRHDDFHDARRNRHTGLLAELRLHAAVQPRRARWASSRRPRS